MPEFSDTVGEAAIFDIAGAGQEPCAPLCFRKIGPVHQLVQLMSKRAIALVPTIPFCKMFAKFRLNQVLGWIRRCGTSARWHTTSAGRFDDSRPDGPSAGCALIPGSVEPHVCHRTIPLRSMLLLQSP